jgi:hypothetical protein
MDAVAKFFRSNARRKDSLVRAPPRGHAPVVCEGSVLKKVQLFLFVVRVCGSGGGAVGYCSEYVEAALVLRGGQGSGVLAVLRGRQSGPTKGGICTQRRSVCHDQEQEKRARAGDNVAGTPYRVPSAVGHENSGGVARLV